MREENLLVSIVLGPPPSRHLPLEEQQILRVAATRTDMRLREGSTGSRARKFPELIDPRGTTAGALRLIDGRLEICDPDDMTLAWMIDLADALGGRVLDNQLRTYGRGGETYLHPVDEQARQRLESQIKAAAKLDQTPPKKRGQWLAPVAIVAVLAVVLLVKLLVGQSAH